MSFLAIKGKTTNMNTKSKHEQITTAQLSKPNCYYEIVEEIKNQRVFIDLDGSFEGSVEDFNILNKKIETALLSYEPLAGVRTSSMYQAQVYRWNDEIKKNELIEIVNKLSFIITYRRMTADVATMKEWIINEELPKLQTLFQGIIPISTKTKVNAIKIDTGVYSHHKLRCPNAWKETEQKERTYKVLKGTLEENIIQNPTGCEMIESIVKVQPEPKPKAQPTNNFPVNPSENVIVVNDFNEVLRALCDKIPHEKWYDYNDWLQINFIWKNEGWDYKIFDEYSKLYGAEKYHENRNKQIWEGIGKKKGLTQATMWEWLKKANLTEFNNLQSKRSDFFLMIENNVNNLDLAVLYYNLQPSKYAYSKTSKWWAYRHTNILVNTGDEKPTSLINDIGYTLRDYFNEQRKLLNPDDKDFKEKNEAIMKIYSKLGVSSFCKGIIDFLPDLYYSEEIDDKIDANTNIIAFNNMLYDLTKNEYRRIKPSDYICRTTGYDFVNIPDPETRKELESLFVSIFPDEETRNYYLKATALSFFTNRFQAFYVLTGPGGRNGKGILDGLIKKALGKYHYTAENTFLTTTIKAGVPNPTLAETNGIRYLSLSEPDNGSETCVLNVDFVKGITGRDPLTCRGLYEKNKTFENRFTTFMLCNIPPAFNKIDKAIIERVKCIPFTERFLANPDPSNPHEHPCNDKLKDILAEQKYINEFMRYMFEIAYANKDISLTEFQVSQLCKERTNEYIEENNTFKFWFQEKYQRVVLPNNFKELKKEEREKYIIRTKTSTILAEYNEGRPKHEQISSRKLRNALTFNDIEVQTYNGSPVIKGYERKPEEEEPKPVQQLLNSLDEVEEE
ncbi:primase-helicase [Essdubovirus chlorellae]|nr:primase-helicase [Chlorella virophage]